MSQRNLAWQAERNLQRLGDHDSLWFEGSWYSSNWSADRASRLATGLAELGVRPGDRVVVLMANCPEVLITYTALWRAGAVVTPLIFLVSAEELHHALVDSGAVGVITTTEFVPKVTAALRDAPEVRFVIAAQGDSAGSGSPVPVTSFDEVASAQPGSIVDREETDLAALLYTGGTTGRSKGVPLTHANLYWCGSSVQETNRRDDLDVTLLSLPLAHAYGLMVTCASMHQTTPSKTILMRWFDAVSWVDLAQRHGARRTNLVPSMIQMLLAQPLEEADLSQLEVVASGASPLPAETRREFEQRVPSAMIYEGYGCTECASIISRNPTDARRVGSVGVAVPGCEITIRDDLGHDLAPGEDGEICVRSPGVMSAYWRSPEARNPGDGWLRTGDIGHLDTDGYLYLVDRKKDLIIRGGFNVFPRDVEEALLLHPAVTAAGVIGRPDERLGEEIVAFVTVRDGHAVTAEELVRHAKGRLAATKYPREIRIVPSLPLTNVGKLDRKRLRALLREQTS
jgi:long-chain acyl-CoA synthetase